MEQSSSTAANTTGHATGAETLSADAYRDRAVYEQERRAIFGCEWLVFCRAGQLAASGTSVAGVLAGYPLVVVRDDAGRLLGFHNVCRHRAGPLTYDGEGTCRGGFVCRYHGWSYRQDGTLLRARDFGDDETFDSNDFSLWGAQVATWAGLVWVNLDLHAPAFEEDLATFAGETDEFPLDRYQFRHEQTEEVACNWKTYVDNYLEGYHIPFVHPTLNTEIDASRYAVDARDRYCVHSAPARDGARNLGKWMWRWPNLAFNLYPNGMNVERIVPVDASTTRIVYTFFFTPGTDAATVDATTQVSVATLAEDRVICEAVQRNLDAGVYETGRLSSKHEAGVFQFHELVRSALGR